MENAGFFEQFFMWLGPYKYPMVIVGIIVVGLIIYKAIELFFIKDLDEARRKRWLNSILFWGSLGLILGIFAQTAGLWIALQQIMKAADISPAMVLIGFYGSFTSTMFGLLILLVSALGWWFLRARARSLVSADISETVI